MLYLSRLACLYTWHIFINIIDTENRFSFLFTNRLVRYCKNSYLLLVLFKRQMACLHIFLWVWINFSRLIFIVKLLNVFASIRNIGSIKIIVLISYTSTDFPFWLLRLLFWSNLSIYIFDFSIWDYPLLTSIPIDIGLSSPPE